MSRNNVADFLVVIAKALLISAMFLALADYFGFPFFNEAGGA